MARTVHVEGLRELDNALGELKKATAKAVLRRVGIKALQPVADTANDLAPDDPATGEPDLKGSFVAGSKLTPRQAGIERRAEGKAFVQVYAGTKDPAGIFQEFGTVNHGPQPMLRPSWDQHQDGVLKTVGTELGGEIDRAAKRAAARALRLKG